MPPTLGMCTSLCWTTENTRFAKGLGSLLPISMSWSTVPSRKQLVGVRVTHGASSGRPASWCTLWPALEVPGLCHLLSPAGQQLGCSHCPVDAGSSGERLTPSLLSSSRQFSGPSVAPNSGPGQLLALEEKATPYFSSLDSSIETLRKRAQDLIESINESRQKDHTFMSNFRDNLKTKVTPVPPPPYLHGRCPSGLEKGWLGQRSKGKVCRPLAFLVSDFSLRATRQSLDSLYRWESLGPILVLQPAFSLEGAHAHWCLGGRK